MARLGRKAKRKYSDDYIKFGFTCQEKEGLDLPQCVICFKVLGNDSMKPAKLKLHLEKCHPNLLQKDEDYFNQQLSAFKRQRLDSTVGTSNGSDDFNVLVPEVQILTPSDAARPSSSCSVSSEAPDSLRPSSPQSMSPGHPDPATHSSLLGKALTQIGPDQRPSRRRSTLQDDRLQSLAEHELTMRVREAELEGAVQYRKACEEWGKAAVAMRESAEKSRFAYEEWSMAAVSVREAAMYFVSTCENMKNVCK